jgi:hypothetical protein
MGTSSTTRRLTEQLPELLGGQPDPAKDSGERAGGELAVERHRDYRVGARSRARAPEDLVIASDPQRPIADSLKCSDGLLAGDAAGQPPGHAGIGTSIEVTSG